MATPEHTNRGHTNLVSVFVKATVVAEELDELGDVRFKYGDYFSAVLLD